MIKDSTFWIIGGIVGTMVGVLGSVTFFPKEEWLLVGMFILILIAGLAFLGHAFSE